MKITFNCEAVTPIFMGGANKQPELRPPSIKGAMRWWFRALYGGHLYSSGENNILEKLHEKESEIFGDTSRNAAFDLRIHKGENFKFDYIMPRSIKMRYLGYGLYGRENRNAINPFSKFSVILNIRSTTQENINYILASFWFLSNLGNIGSRSRRGFGSFKVNSVSDNSLNGYFIFDVKSFRKSINYYLDILTINNITSGIEPLFPVITKDKWKCYLLNGRDESFSGIDSAFNHIGNKLREFRSEVIYPLRTKTIPKRDGTEVIIRYKHSLEYDNIIKSSPASGTAGSVNTPHWSIFGLPHPFELTGYGKITITGIDRERRASSLIIKICKFNGNYRIILQKFESKFLDCGIRFEKDETNYEDLKSCIIGYNKINEFLDSFSSKTDLILK